MLSGQFWNWFILFLHFCEEDFFFIKKQKKIVYILENKSESDEGDAWVLYDMTIGEWQRWEET